MRSRSGVRSRKKRRFALRKSTVRLLAKILVVAVAIAIGSWFVGRMMRPIKLVTSEQRDRDRIVADYRSLRTQNEDLRR